MYIIYTYWHLHTDAFPAWWKRPVPYAAIILRPSENLMAIRQQRQYASKAPNEELPVYLSTFSLERPEANSAFNKNKFNICFKLL